MKKIILVLILILMSACHYEELDSLGNVSTLVIDYSNYRFQVTVEIKEMKDKDKTNAYTLKASANSLNYALEKIENNSGKTLYFNNLDILLITAGTLDRIDDALKDIHDDFGFSFNTNVALINNPIEAINIVHSYDGIFGEYFKAVIKKGNPKNNITYYDFIKYYETDKKVVIPKATLKNDEIVFNIIEVKR